MNTAAPSAGDERPSRPEEETKRGFLDVLADVDRNAQSSYPDDYSLPAGLRFRLIIGLDARARGLFQSIWHLLGSDHAEEAAILCRSLFTDCLTLGYFLKYKPSAEQLAVGLYRRMLTDELGLLHLQRRYGTSPGNYGVDDNASDMRALEDYGRSIGMTSFPRFPREEALCVAIDQPRFFYFYKWACGRVHTSRQALEARIDDTPGRMQVRSTTTDFATWAGVALFAGELFTYGHTAACLFLDWDTASHVEAFREHTHERLRVLMVGSGIPRAARIFEPVRRCPSRPDPRRVMAGSHPIPVPD